MATSALKGSNPQRNVGSGLIAWLVPDLAATFALTTVVSLFGIFGGATALFSDSDSGWHIRNGEGILATRSLPHADPFSFSKPGGPWVTWEWGADVLMGAANSVSGLGGVALLYGFLIGASVWMWFRLSHVAGGNVLLACLFVLPMLPTTKMHWLARPHVFSWLFLLATVWACERAPHRLRWRHLVLAAMMAAVWANLHASFFFGPLIAFIYAAGVYLKPWIWQPLPRGELEPTAEAGGRSYILLAIAASLGTLANPNGWRLHQHVFLYLSNTRMLDQIIEFQSFNFHLDGAFQILVTITLCFAGAFAALAAHKPERFLLSMLLTAGALHAVRVLPVAALLLLPLANGSITIVLGRARNLTAGFRRRLDQVLAYGDGLHAIEGRFHGFAIIPLAAILIYASIRHDAGFPPDHFPVAASAAVAMLPASARILAPDTFAGYLIYRFSAKRKVFFDGRSDFYGREFSERYLRLVEAQPGWRNDFNRWGFTHALLPPDYRLIGELEANGWHELYRDRTAVLLTGRSRL